MRFLAMSFLLLMSAPAYPAPPSAEQVRGEPVVARLHLAGEAQNGILMIKATLGEGITRAVRVYAEPSHTLVAVYVNEDVPEPLNAAWMDSVLTNAERTRETLPVARFPFRPGADAVITTTAAPATDAYFRVFVFGSWVAEDGGVKEQERSFSIATNLASFSFNFALRVNPEPDAVHDVMEGRDRGPRKIRRFVTTETVCCGSEGDCGGGQACVSCSGSQYCCGKYTGTGCDWCTTNYITCALRCDPCA